MSRKPEPSPLPNPLLPRSRHPPPDAAPAAPARGALAGRLQGPFRPGGSGNFALPLTAGTRPGPAALERIDRASRRFCCLSGWSGAQWGPWGLARRELWPRLFREDPGSYPNDVLYAFGWLYARGYCPQLRFRQASRQCQGCLQWEVSPGEAVATV